MSQYASITDFIPELETASDANARDLLYQRFVPTCYERGVLDYEYPETLQRAGVSSNGIYHANVEALDLPTTLALLTAILRADHKNDRALLSTLSSGYLLRVLRRIAELDGTWERPGLVTFYHEYDKDGYLSNWYAASLSFGGNTFVTSEHWMMWQKACVFGDWGIADKSCKFLRRVKAKSSGSASR